MPIEEKRMKALIFDVFGTVVDWRTGVANVATTAFAERGIEADPFGFAAAWRAQYDPAMEKIRAGNRGYVRLDVLHRENLDVVLADFGLEDQFNEAARADFNRAWEKLPPWPDSVAGLTALKARYAIAPCSNGSIALMTWLAKFGGLPWDAILGAEIAGNYKPAREVYLASAAALGLEPGEVMMVAAHNSDLAAAREAGLKTAFFPRPAEHGPSQTSDLEAASDWDIVAADLEDLARKVGA
jgi:2-haloacid dehalogenase